MQYLIAFLFLGLVGCAHPEIMSNPFPAVPVEAVLYVTNGNACSSVAVSASQLYTAAHCVDEDRSITVMYKGEAYQGTVSWVDHELDLATIDMSQSLFKVWAHAYVDEIKAGDQLVQVGYGCVGNEVREAHFEGVELDGDVVSLVETCGGDSGGGLFTPEGGLVGIISQRATKGPGRSYSRSPWY